MNLETECMYDLINHRGFLITEMPFSDIDKTIRNVDGPRSPRFGTTFGDNNEFSERYTCSCKRSIGAVFEGELCPDCGTPIEYTDVDILYTGWISFFPYKIINPLFFQRLQSAISKKNLDNIIANDNIITANGLIRKYNDPIEVKKSMLMYHNIGLKEFYENYEEIMTHFKQKRKMKADLIDSLIKDKDLVWTSKIPIYSTSLRQFSVSQESIFFSPIDKQIHPLTSISLNLKTASMIEVPLYLYQAQLRVNELWGINFSLIEGKHGFVRSNVLGGCYNSTLRAVIVLDCSLKMDEVDLSYKGFLIAYSGLIVKKLRKKYGWTITRALNYLKSKFIFDQEIYDIMQEIVTESRVDIILNRNPR